MQQYFTRLWVQQEMALAQDLYFFSRGISISMHPVIHFVAWKNSLDKATKTRPAYIPAEIWVNLRMRWFRFRSFNFYGTAKLYLYENEYSNPTQERVNELFFDLVVKANSFLARNPLDKIFALSALPGVQRIVDYEIAARDLYQGFVEGTAIQTRGDLTFLQYSGRRSKASDLGLPSWVPDFSQDWGISTWTREYCAEQDLGFIELEVTSDRHLRVNGCVCDYVTTAEPRYDFGTSEPLMAFISYAFGTGSNSIEYPGGGSRTEAFLRSYLLDTIPCTLRRLSMTTTETADVLFGVLLALMISDKNIQQTFRDGQESARNIVSCLSQDLQKRGLAFSDDEKEMDAMMVRIFENQQKAEAMNVGEDDYRFFHTAKGYLGVCHGGAEVGAEVCVLAGCKMPVLLKKLQDGYELIEVCFVLGFMDGEAAEQMRAGTLEEQVFEIH